MNYDIVFIPGDGVGPEVSEAAKRCVEATGVTINWHIAEAGADAMEKYKTPLPDSTLDLINKYKIALKGPVTTPVGEGFRSVNVKIRKELNLYACVRPCKLYKGVKSHYSAVDLIVIRENTEDLYAGIEFPVHSTETKSLIDYIHKLNGEQIRSDSGISIKPISEYGSSKIIDFAFKYAIKNKRKKITAVHKANIMKFSDGLFLETYRKIAKDYKDKIEFTDRIVDNMSMQLVQKPELYDVLVLPNLYGDIISDLCAGLVGGLGVTPGANIGDDIAVFEATHGSAPKYAGKNKVNPSAMILSSMLMLRYIGEDKAANNLENAVSEVIQEGKNVTYDLKLNRDDPSAVGTSQMADAIIRQITEDR